MYPYVVVISIKNTIYKASVSPKDKKFMPFFSGKDRIFNAVAQAWCLLGGGRGVIGLVRAGSREAAREGREAPISPPKRTLSAGRLTSFIDNPRNWRDCCGSKAKH
jgi:hypothetical protein